MKFELMIEKCYSNCYPKEQADDSNCFKLKYNTIEEVSDYVNTLYEKTKEYCHEKPRLKLEELGIQGWVLQTYDYIPKDKQATKADIIKLLRDKNDYDTIPKRDIEMYSISVWLKVLK